MTPAAHNKIVSFIWSIADDVLRDLFNRGKYRDVILPMCVLRRLDAVLEPTKRAVLDRKKQLDDAGIVEQAYALRAASGEAFYNTSRFTLRDLVSRGTAQQLRADFEDYLDGFSPNVQEILKNFEFRNVLGRLSDNDVLGTLVEKFLDPDINLSPRPVVLADGTVRHEAMDNHAMGTVFEELVRKFNEENNEEAGEHWTPRDAVALMARLVFEPVADQLKSGSYLLYDGACGTGGMLTVGEDALQHIAHQRGLDVNAYLCGQEINPETYAICKADMLLKGEGENADNIVGGAGYSTLSNDAFPAETFDFMLSNPPYGKSWGTDQDLIGGKNTTDPRFLLNIDGEEVPAITRSSDGQLMFLANLVAKMQDTPLGSRIAQVHNGSSLFTGDAGSGESTIRRYVFERDLVEAVVALPLNLFYNTPIATYVWVLTNRKPEGRRGRTQLIDATTWFKPLRKNLGKKNCELSADDIDRVLRAFADFEETGQSKIFDNRAFGYHKITVERPLRFTPGPDFDPKKVYKAAEIKRLKERLTPDPEGEPVIKKRTRAGVIEYEPDTDLRDTEQVPLLEPGGTAAFFGREVRPHAPDAWIDEKKTKIGYEVSFTRYFYKPPVLRSLDEIKADIAALEAETEGLLQEIVGIKG